MVNFPLFYKDGLKLHLHAGTDFFECNQSRSSVNSSNIQILHPVLDNIIIHEKDFVSPNVLGT